MRWKGSKRRTIIVAAIALVFLVCSIAPENQAYAASKFQAPKLTELSYYQSVDGSYNATVKWKSKKGQTFRILRKQGKSKYKVVGTAKATGKSCKFTDKNIGNHSYTYSVQRYANGKKGKYDKKGIKTLAATTVKVSYTNLHAKISWKKVSGAKKYKIYRKCSTKGSWKLVGTVDKSKTSYTDVYKKSSGNKEIAARIIDKAFIDPSENDLVYTVRAYSVTKAKKTKKHSYGLYYKDGEFRLEEPSITDFSRKSSDSAELSWGTVPNAEGYHIYTREEGESWHIIKDVEQGKDSILSAEIEPGSDSAYYTVQAFAKKNGKELRSGFDTGFNVKNRKYDQEICWLGDSITYGSPYYSYSTSNSNPGNNLVFSFSHRVAQLVDKDANDVNTESLYYNPSIPGSTYYALYKGNMADWRGDFPRRRIVSEVANQIAIGKPVPSAPLNWEKTKMKGKKDLSKGHYLRWMRSYYYYADQYSNDMLSDSYDKAPSFKDFDIVVMAAGTNDYLDDAPLGNINVTNDTTFYGALNKIFGYIENASVQRIKEGKAPIKVVMLDLFYSDRTNSYSKIHNRDVTKNNRGLTLQDYQKALNSLQSKWDGSKYHLDFYRYNTRQVVSHKNAPYRLSDNLHFTKYAYQLYGNSMANFMINNVFNAPTSVDTNMHYELTFNVDGSEFAASQTADPYELANSNGSVCFDIDRDNIDESVKADVNAAIEAKEAEGYEFIGWSRTKGATEPDEDLDQGMIYEFENDPENYSMHMEATIYAVFEKIEGNNSEQFDESNMIVEDSIEESEGTVEETDSIDPTTEPSTEAESEATDN